MAVNWQNGLVNSGFDVLEAFNAGRSARLQENQTRRQEQQFQRAEAARQAEADYFTARHTPSITDAGIDRGTEMSGQSTVTADQPNGIGQLISLGQQSARPNEALLRLAQADPSRAFALEDREKAARAQDLENMHKLNAASGRLLAGVSDQASYENAMGRMKRMFARFGESMDDYEVPSTYDPNYVQRLRMSALDIDKQLAAERGSKRLEWDIEDDQLDNDRADRNTDSVIADRSARRDITVRGQNLSDARSRRGQDIADARGRRGQDIASSDRRRGQDVTDRRLRETGRGRKSPTSPLESTSSPAKSPGGQGQKFSRTATDPKTGKQVGWNGSSWVPVN